MDARASAVEGDRPIAADALADPCVAFAGIAKPARFFASLESLGIRVGKRVEFRDHHRYSAEDIAGLGSGTLITTEKDAVRLEGRVSGRLLHLRISAHVAELDRLLAIAPLPLLL